MPLLVLTRARLRSCLPDGAEVRWYGGFDESAWTEQSPATVVVLK